MGLPKNSINTPLELTKQEILERLDRVNRENKRLRSNSESIKLQLIESREKLNKIKNILKDERITL